MIYSIALGRLGKDPETKTVNGKTLVRFSIASDHGTADNKHTDWLNCSAWEKRGEFVAKYFHKGDTILVRGNLTSREHEGKTYWEMDVEKADFTGTKKETAPAVTPAPPADFLGDGCELPFDL
jgi:single-strand DNA-binding protein